MEFWRTFIENPSEEKSMNDFAIAIDNIPKIVFSQNLKNVRFSELKSEDSLINQFRNILKLIFQL